MGPSQHESPAWAEVKLARPFFFADGLLFANGLAFFADGSDSSIPSLGRLVVDLR